MTGHIEEQCLEQSWIWCGPATSLASPKVDGWNVQGLVCLPTVLQACDELPTGFFAHSFVKSLCTRVQTLSCITLKFNKSINKCPSCKPIKLYVVTSLIVLKDQKPITSALLPWLQLYDPDWHLNVQRLRSD